MLLGSSRVMMGIPVDERQRDDVLNAAMPGVTLDETAAMVLLSFKNPRLRRVLWGIDYYTFGPVFIGFRDLETAQRLQRGRVRRLWLRVGETLLSRRALSDSLRLLAPLIGMGAGPPRFLAAPWTPAMIRESFDAVNADGMPHMSDALLSKYLVNHEHMLRNNRAQSHRGSHVRQELRRLRGNGIAVTMFVPPISDCELAFIRRLGQWDAFQAWKADLLEAAGPYYDFSGYHDLATDPRLWEDPVHFKPVVGHVILRFLLDLDCSDCGPMADRVLATAVRVDADTIAGHLAQQEARYQRAAEDRPRCVAMVERQLARITAAAQPGAPP
jgi:hypothetical protein